MYHFRNEDYCIEYHKIEKKDQETEGFSTYLRLSIYKKMEKKNDNLLFWNCKHVL